LTEEEGGLTVSLYIGLISRQSMSDLHEMIAAVWGDRGAMSRFTSALVFASPLGVGPFFSDEWRVSWCANLVEGSSAGPYWLPLPSYEDHLKVESMMIDSIEPELVADSLILLLGAVFGSEGLNWLLRESQNLIFPDDGKPAIAPYWDLANDVRDCCVRDLATRIKIGIACLDEHSLLCSQAIQLLRGFGFRVEVFSGQAP
jgi:hypothetical protein